MQVRQPKANVCGPLTCDRAMTILYVPVPWPRVSRCDHSRTVSTTQSGNTRWNWGVVDVNAPGAAAPGSSAFASFGVASVPGGAMIPLFSANRDDGSKVVNMVVKSVDGITESGWRASNCWRQRGRAPGWLEDRGMTLRGVAVRSSLGTLTLDWLAATSFGA